MDPFHRKQELYACVLKKKNAFLVERLNCHEATSLSHLVLAKTLFQPEKKKESEPPICRSDCLETHPRPRKPRNTSQVHSSHASWFIYFLLHLIPPGDFLVGFMSMFSCRLTALLRNPNVKTVENWEVGLYNEFFGNLHINRSPNKSPKRWGLDPLAGLSSEKQEAPFDMVRKTDQNQTKKSGGN